MSILIIQFGVPEDIQSWLSLVRKVSWNFPGLETEEEIMECYNAGIRDFGENKVQDMVTKMEHLPSDINWHLIGHLQTNKVKYIVDKATLIHSVDSVRLASEIEKEANKRGVIANILIQVNIAHEDTKFGINEDEIYDYTYAGDAAKKIAYF